MPDEERGESADAAGDAPADGAGPTVEAARGDAGAAPDDGAAAAEPKRAGGRVLSIYGIGSAVLGLVSVAAVVAGLVMWSAHHRDVDERGYRSRVLQTAASWTSVLINLNAENVEKGMQRLRDKTVGQLSTEFDASVQPYRDVVQKIQSRSTGRIEAVAIESVHHDPGALPGAASSDPGEQPAPPVGGRTDTVMVIATSVAENIGGKPQTVHWALQLDVSDVNGQLLISRLKSIR